MKYLFTALYCLFFFSTAVAQQNTGVRSPGSVINSGSSSEWQNPSGAASSGSGDAYCVLPNGGTNYSSMLVATGFGFSLPATATITGVVVSVTKQADYQGVYDMYAQLVIGGTPVTTWNQNMYKPDEWSYTGYQAINYGGSSNTWFATLTPSIVNNAGFGFHISCQSSNTNEDPIASVDWISMTVYYTVPPPPPGIAISSDGSSPAASAILELKSTSQGLLLPRMTTTQRTLINSPATGLMVYDITANKPFYYNGTSWQTFTPTSNAPAGGGNGVSENESDLLNIIEEQHKKIIELTNRLEVLEKQLESPKD